MSKLFNNKQASFQVLKKLGFEKVNNRLIFRCDVQQTQYIMYLVEKVDFQFFELNSNISLRFKSFIRDIADNIDINRKKLMKNNNYNYHYNNQTAKDVSNYNYEVYNYNYKNDDDIDTILSELFDQLPDLLLENMQNEIYSYIENNDFQLLAKFLHKKMIEYKRNNIKIVITFL